MADSGFSEDFLQTITSVQWGGGGIVGAYANLGTAADTNVFIGPAELIAGGGPAPSLVASPLLLTAAVLAGPSFGAFLTVPSNLAGCAVFFPIPKPTPAIFTFHCTINIADVTHGCFLRALTTKSSLILGTKLTITPGAPGAAEIASIDNRNHSLGGFLGPTDVPFSVDTKTMLFV